MDYQHMQQKQHMQIMETAETVSCFLNLNAVTVFLSEYAGVIPNELLFFISIHLYSPDKIVRIRNWHRFSNTDSIVSTYSWLPEGYRACLSPLLYKS
jgi:hypothetical protein